MAEQVGEGTHVTLNGSSDPTGSSTIENWNERRLITLKLFASLLGATHIQNQVGPIGAGIITGVMNLQLMGMHSGSSAARAIELMSLLVDDIFTIWALPSLDLLSGDDAFDLAGLAAAKESNILSSQASASSTGVTDAPRAGAGLESTSYTSPPLCHFYNRQVKIPAMTASVFDIPVVHHRSEAFASASPSAAPSTVGATASISDAGERMQPLHEDSAKRGVDKKELEDEGAKKLAKPISWTRSSSPQAPMTLLRSLSASFSALVDSKMKSWTLLLLRHSLSSGDENSRSRLLSLLATNSTISLTSVTTSFHTLILPKEFASTKAEEKGKIILPLIFDTMFDISLKNQAVPVNLKAPGTIVGKIKYFVSVWELDVYLTK